MDDPQDPLAGIELFSNLQLKRRTVVLAAHIDDTMASHVISRLLLLDAEQPEIAILVYLNAMSGSVGPALAIADTVRYVNAEVSTVAIGPVTAEGAAILAAGASGKRRALQTSLIRLKLTTDVSGASDGLGHSSEDSGFWLESLAKFIAEQTRQPTAKVTKDLLSNQTLTPVEARIYGLIDHVVASTPGMPTSN